MTLWRCFDGSRHPVSERWLQAVDSDLNGRSHADLTAEYTTLAMPRPGSEDLLGRENTEEEIRRLNGIVHVLNLNRALRFLDFRDYRSMFGITGTLCQVHGNYWHPDTCDCRVSMIFDHWKRETPNEIVLHPHHYGRKLCKKHAYFENDLDGHFNAVLAENRKKNLVAEIVSGKR